MSKLQIGVHTNPKFGEVCLLAYDPIGGRPVGDISGRRLLAVQAVTADEDAALPLRDSLDRLHEAVCLELRTT